MYFIILRFEVYNGEFERVQDVPGSPHTLSIQHPTFELSHIELLVRPPVKPRTVVQISRYVYE